MSRSEYSDDERLQILWYIINNDRYLSLRGNTVWKDMEHDNVCERTWQSMKSHFQNKIINNLFYYDIPQNKKDRILQGYKSTCVKKKTKDGRTVRLPVQKVMVFSSDEEEMLKRVKQPLPKRKVTPEKLIAENSDDSTDLLNEKAIRYSNKEDTHKQIQLSPEVDLIKVKNTNGQLQESPPKIAKVTRSLNLPISKCRNKNLKLNIFSNKLELKQKCELSKTHIFPSTSRVENIISVDENKNETTNQVQHQTNVKSFSKSCKTRNKGNQIEQVQEKVNDTNISPRTIIKCVGFEEEVTYIQPIYYPETRDQFVQVGNSSESKSTQLEINKCDTPVSSNKFELNLLGEKLVVVKIGVDNHIFVSASDMKLVRKEIKDELVANKEKIHVVNSETFNLLKSLHNINNACVLKVQAAVFSKELDFFGLKSYVTQMEDILNKAKKTFNFAETSEHSQEQTNTSIESKNSDIPQKQNKSKQTLETQKTNPKSRKITTVSGITKIHPSPTAQKYNSSQEIEGMDISKEPSSLIGSQEHISLDLKINTQSSELLKYLTSTEPQKLDNLAGIRIKRTSKYEKRSFDSESIKSCPQKVNSQSETPELNLSNSSLKNVYTSVESQKNDEASSQISQTLTESSKTTTFESQNINLSPKYTSQEFQNSAQHLNKSSIKQHNSIKFLDNSELNSQNLVSVPMEEGVDITKIMLLLNNDNQIPLNESIELLSTCESDNFYTAHSQDLNITNHSF